MISGSKRAGILDAQLLSPAGMLGPRPKHRAKRASCAVPGSSVPVIGLSLASFLNVPTKQNELAVLQDFGELLDQVTTQL
jgi:hypothetical protein